MPAQLKTLYKTYIKNPHLYLIYCTSKKRCFNKSFTSQVTVWLPYVRFFRKNYFVNLKIFCHIVHKPNKFYCSTANRIIVIQKNHNFLRLLHKDTITENKFVEEFIFHLFGLEFFLLETLNQTIA